PAPKLSALPNLPDHRFKVKVEHMEPEIAEPSCRMTMLAVMRELTLMNFEDELSGPGARAWVHPTYSGAIILVSPAAGIKNASIRFAIWTIYEAMRDTLRTEICSRTYHVGEWEGQDIVKVMILQQPPTTASQNQTVNTQGAEIAAFKIALAGAGANGSFSVASTGLSKTNNLGDDELHADIAYRPKSMDQPDIFMAMTGIMLRLAPTNQQDLGVFSDNSIAITHEVISIFNRAAKSVPYVITTGDLISLVADVPGFLLLNNKWQEIDLTVTANEFPGVVIARGIIRDFHRKRKHTTIRPHKETSPPEYAADRIRTIHSLRLHRGVSTSQRERSKPAMHRLGTGCDLVSIPSQSHQSTLDNLESFYAKILMLGLGVLAIPTTYVVIKVFSTIYQKVLDSLLDAWAERPNQNQLMVKAGKLGWEFGCMITPMPCEFLKEYYERNRDAVERGFLPVFEREWVFNRTDRGRYCFAGMRIAEEGAYGLVHAGAASLPNSTSISHLVTRRFIIATNTIITIFQVNYCASTIFSSAMAPYQYQPLDPEAKTIRLLRLLPGSFEDDICVSLKTAVLRERRIPKYEALSYAWGSKEEPVNISVTTHRRIGPFGRWSLILKRKNAVDGRLEVTQNLAVALRHLRPKDKNRDLWIDAVCVDQRNLVERGHQVERMADIYRNAVQVVAWIGPAGDNSALAMETLGSLGSRIEVDWDAATISAISPDDTDLADLYIPIPYDNKTWNSLRSLLNRNWFKRLWVWQEMLLARSANLQCGYNSIGWSNFRKAIRCIFLKPHLLDRDLYGHINSFICAEAFSYALEVLVYLTQQCECSDPRDRIYAVLDIVQPEDSAVGLKPDYIQTPSRIFQDVVLRALSHKGDLQLMRSHCEGNTDMAGKPSWVPDFSKSRISNPIPVARCCFGSKASAEYAGNGLLEVTGINVADISDITKIEERAHTANLELAIRSLIGTVNFRASYLDGSDMLDAVCRTLCMDFLADNFTPALEKHPTLEMASQYIRRLSHDSTAEAQPSYLSRVKYYMKGRYFFTTKQGYIGLLPEAGKRGDQVYVILGCQSPLLLRRMESGNMVVIGECYIHALMTGDALLGTLPPNWQFSRILNAGVVIEMVLLTERLEKTFLRIPGLGGCLLVGDLQILKHGQTGTTGSSTTRLENDRNGRRIRG
ncbi:MAG: hypothetical protein Q9226_006629, partial [Calogaya cf. arnoldii]